jgi:hypothetical protein
VADAKGLVIYCADNPVGTHPDGIQDLLHAGARVWFVNRLHAKVYWSSASGALIGSPNLSTNALGESGLFETLYDVEGIDINGLLRAMKLHARPVEVTPRVLEQFRRACARAEGRVPRIAVRRAEDVPTFEEWVKDNYRKPFSIVYWDYTGASKLTAPEREEVREYNEEHDTGLGERYQNYLTIAGDVVPMPANEDVLCVHLLSGERITTQGTFWLRCDLRTISRTGRGGAGKRTRLIQVRPRTTRVPFRPAGSALQAALTKFFRDHPPGKLEGTVIGTGTRNEKWLLQASEESDE